MKQPKNPISELNEFCQKQYGKTPKYKLVDVQGEPHQPFLEYSLTMPNGDTTKAIGSSKRQAKTTLAINYLESL